jgi:hypothetical protein
MKYHPHGTVLYVTSSIEEGVLFLCNPLCLALLQSCLSVAIANHPVELCHFIVEATHIHMVLVVKDPEDVAGFLRTFKCESAHMINGLLGRRKRTVWCEGYDSPIVLTPIRALVAISYLYSNPAKDNLTESIREYEGFSSWGKFTSGEYSETYKRLRRPQFEFLPLWRQNPAGYKAEADKLLSESTEQYSLNLTPNAWLDAFGITDKDEQQKWNDRIHARVQALEDRAAKVRKRKGHRVIGPERLRRAMFELTRRPKGRSGKRMWCLSESRKVRQHYISFLKGLMFSAREVARRWKLGDFSVSYPPGLYAPCMPRLANVMS